MICRALEPIAYMRFETCLDYRIYGGGGYGLDGIPHCGKVAEWKANKQIQECRSCYKWRKKSTPLESTPNPQKPSGGFWKSVKRLFTEPKESKAQRRAETLPTKKIRRTGAVRSRTNPLTAQSAARTGPAMLQRQDEEPVPVLAQTSEEFLGEPGLFEVGGPSLERKPRVRLQAAAPAAHGDSSCQNVKAAEPDVPLKRKLRVWPQTAASAAHGGFSSCQNVKAAESGLALPSKAYGDNFLELDVSAPPEAYGGNFPKPKSRRHPTEAFYPPCREEG